ncbi:hypothetical protein ACVGXT_00465, partial [Enterobacter intestinihominis]
MASGRLFIPGELKIFHGGTPVLGPPRGGATTFNRCLTTHTLTKKTQQYRHPAHKHSNKKIKKN